MGEGTMFVIERLGIALAQSELRIQQLEKALEEASSDKGEAKPK